MKKEIPLGVSVKFSAEHRENYPELLTSEEFLGLLSLSGETSKTVLMHKALRAYGAVLRGQLEKEQRELVKRQETLDRLFPPKV